MLERIEAIREQARAAIESAPDAAAVEEARVRFLGRKAELTTILRGIGDLPAEQRGPVGKTGNEVRRELEDLLAAAKERHERAELDSRLAAESIDVTLPGTPPVRLGHLHPLTRTRREIEDVFVGLGYQVVEGPEVEHDYYNFTALNYPPGHPARMLQDTFYVDPASLGPAAALVGSDGGRLQVPAGPRDVLLRTHTSPMQIRGMEDREAPIFIVVPGRVYRRDSDATHTPMFNQIEGLAVGEGITLADLHGTLLTFAREIFGPRPGSPDPAALLPVHRAQRRGRRLLLPLRRHRRLRVGTLQPLQGDGLARDPRGRHGRPERVRIRAGARLRPRAGPGIRLRARHRAGRDAQARRPRPADVLR